MREKALALVAGVTVIAAVVGFSLFFCVRVPDNAAAKVDDSFIYEPDVASWIAQYRAANSLGEDESFARALLSANMNIASFRQSVVNQLALKQLVQKRADELGVTVSEEEVEAQMAASKELYTMGSDDVWADTLAMFEMDEDSLREQYRANLRQRAICEADVPRREATDEDVLSYVKQYLAGTTQKHVSRIVFTGDDADERSKECHKLLLKTAGAGNLDAERFGEIAKQYSDEANVLDTAGSLGWSGAAVNEEIKQLLGDLSVNEFSGPTKIEEDGAVEIVYCDSEYVFPNQADFDALPGDAPKELMDEVRDATADSLWDADCDSYLSQMLANAKITYYPVPDGAAYNVSMSVSSAE